MKKWDKNNFLTKTFGYIRKKHYLCSRKHLKKYHYFQGFYGRFTTKTNKQEESRNNSHTSGITQAKQKIARATGIPMTKQGLERKIGNAILKGAKKLIK